MRFEAIGLIQDERRSLAAVIQAAEFLVRKYIRESKAPDFKLLHAMLFYVREFPDCAPDAGADGSRRPRRLKCASRKE